MLTLSGRTFFMAIWIFCPWNFNFLINVVIRIDDSKMTEVRHVMNEKYSNSGSAPLILTTKMINSNAMSCVINWKVILMWYMSCLNWQSKKLRVSEDYAEPKKAVIIINPNAGSTSFDTIVNGVISFIIVPHDAANVTVKMISINIFIKIAYVKWVLIASAD